MYFELKNASLAAVQIVNRIQTNNASQFASSISTHILSQTSSINISRNSVDVSQVPEENLNQVTNSNVTQALSEESQPEHVINEWSETQTQSNSSFPEVIRRIERLEKSNQELSQEVKKRHRESTASIVTYFSLTYNYELINPLIKDLQ